MTSINYEESVIDEFATRKSKNIQHKLLIKKLMNEITTDYKEAFGVSMFGEGKRMIDDIDKELQFWYAQDLVLSAEITDRLLKNKDEGLSYRYRTSILVLKHQLVGEFYVGLLNIIESA